MSAKGSFSLFLGQEPQDLTTFQGLSQGHLSCCISRFAEPMVGKARAGKLEEISRSWRNCRHIYALLTGTAAVAADTLYSLAADPADAAIT